MLPKEGVTKAEAIFDLLDRWRHLPAYQIERRADIFFALYLPEIIAYKFAVDTKVIIPEFPIRIGEISTKTTRNQSFKVDYLVITKQSDYFLLVELKTDNASIRPEQDHYLATAQNIGMHKLVEGVIKLPFVSKQKQKYRSLMNLLHEAGLVEKSTNGYQNVTRPKTQLELLYIQPTKVKDGVARVSFLEVAEIVAKHTDTLSQRFARSLLAWEKSPATID